MKKLFILFGLFTILFTSCGPTQDDVVKANDAFVDIIDKCSVAEKSFFDVCETFVPASIDKELKTFMSVCENAKKEIEALKVHKEVETLKSSALKLVDAYIAEKPNYTEYAKLYSISNEEYTEEDEEQTAEVSNKINTVIDGGFQDFASTQDVFAKKYNFIIEEKK